MTVVSPGAAISAGNCAQAGVDNARNARPAAIGRRWQRMITSRGYLAMIARLNSGQYCRINADVRFLPAHIILPVPAQGLRMAQIHFTSWLRTVVPDAPVTASGEGAFPGAQSAGLCRPEVCRRGRGGGPVRGGGPPRPPARPPGGPRRIPVLDAGARWPAPSRPPVDRRDSGRAVPFRRSRRELGACPPALGRAGAGEMVRRRL